jgi:CubicO group peptidase (beta-lactamase class C family)
MPTRSLVPRRIRLQKSLRHGDLERRVPLTTSAPIITGSIAKQFTAAVVAHLAREKKLSLSDSIASTSPSCRRTQTRSRSTT